MNTRFLCLSCLFSVLSLSIKAAEVIQGVTATASSQWSGSQAASNLVNNSGLRTAGSTPGNETATTYDVTAVHNYDQSANGQWHNTGPADPGSTITFNLGSAFNLEAIHIWNGNQWGGTDLTARGAQQIDILTSTDGTNFTEVLANQTLNKSPGGTYVSAQAFSLIGNSGVTHVRIRIDSNYGDAYTGLSEVMFTRVTDPSLTAPSSHDFGAISMLQTDQENVAITNPGATQTLNISSVSITGPDATSFTLNSSPSSLAPGATGNINVTFHPNGATGDFNAKIEIVSNKYGIPGTVTEINLIAEALPDPLLDAPTTQSFGRIFPTAAKQVSIPLTNLGITTNLDITGVSLSGTHAGKFSVNSFPTSLAPGASSSIDVTFNPGGEEGDFTAVLEITCNDEGISSSVVPITLSAAADLLGQLSAPVITAAAPGYNGSYVASNLFDSTNSEFATLGGGAGTPLSQSNGTWVELDFGMRVTIDRMILVTRANSADAIGVSRLILSNDSTFEETDTIHVFNNTGSNGQGLIHAFPATTARYARWEVTTSIGLFQNLGGMELRFLNTPQNWQPTPVTIYNGATAFSGDYSLDNAIDGDAGRSPGVEYASQSLGPDMFVDFDLGSAQPIVGFDFFDRIPSVDRTTAFNLLLSNDPTFATGVTTLSFAPGSSNWGFRRSITPILARYIRFDATQTTGAFSNSGMQEILFYTAVPPVTGTPYEQYIATTWNLNGAQAAADFDYDNDGFDNGIEFVLGTNPLTPNATTAPTVTLDASMLHFTHRLSSAAVSDNPVVQYSTNLTTWTTAVHGANGITITTQDDQFGVGIDGVTVNIPRALNNGGRIFTRLFVDVALTP